MNIGIITWFSGDNYGTNLQAISLQHYLRMKGHEVKLLNFEISGTSNNQTRTFITRLLSQPEKYAIKYFSYKYKKKIEEKKRRMQATVLSCCNFTNRINNNEDYVRECNTFDLLICGSDQIWNPNWYHKFYYADCEGITTRKISYAPSLGVNSVTEEKAKKIKHSLKSFETVLVREYNAVKILENISPVAPQVVVDPTLLINAKEWSEFASSRLERGKYVLSMFLTDNFWHWHAAKKFAKSKKLKHIIIPYHGISYLQGDELYVNAGLEDFLALIRDAEYILTDSFHVMVFSLIFNRKFWGFKRFKENQFTSQNSRVEDLLQLIGLSYRLLPYGTKNICENDTIDYNRVNELLKREIKRSQILLEKAIQKDNHNL